MNVRAAGRLLALGAIALLLAGCFKVNMDVEVTPENTVSGTAIIAVDESLLGLSGQSADQLFEDMDLSDLPAGATTETYEEDGFVGQEITFAEVSLEDFKGNETLSGSSAGDALNIARQGDEFHVTGAIDMGGEQFTGTEVPQEFLESFEFTISITFPGEVKSATGEVDGNTVTWEPKVGENTRLEAVASAIPSKSSPLLMILLIAAGALVLGVIAFLLTHRKAPLPAAGPTEDGTAMPVEAMPVWGPTDPVAPAELPPDPPEAPVTPFDPPPPPPASDFPPSLPSRTVVGPAARPSSRAARSPTRMPPSCAPETIKTLCDYCQCSQSQRQSRPKSPHYLPRRDVARVARALPVPEHTEGLRCNAIPQAP